MATAAATIDKQAALKAKIAKMSLAEKDARVQEIYGSEQINVDLFDELFALLFGF